MQNYKFTWPKRSSCFYAACGFHQPRVILVVPVINKVLGQNDTILKTVSPQTPVNVTSVNLYQMYIVATLSFNDPKIVVSPFEFFVKQWKSIPACWVCTDFSCWGCSSFYPANTWRKTPRSLQRSENPPLSYSPPGLQSQGCTGNTLNGSLASENIDWDKTRAEVTHWEQFSRAMLRKMCTDLHLLALPQITTPLSENQKSTKKSSKCITQNVTFLK